MDLVRLPSTAASSYRVWRIHLPLGPQVGLVAAAQEFGPRTRWLVAWLKHLEAGWPLTARQGGLDELWGPSNNYTHNSDNRPNFWAEDITAATLLDPDISSLWARHAPGWLWQTIILCPDLALSRDIFRTLVLSKDPIWRLRALQLIPRLTRTPPAHE